VAARTLRQPSRMMSCEMKIAATPSAHHRPRPGGQPARELLTLEQVALEAHEQLVLAHLHRHHVLVALEHRAAWDQAEVGQQPLAHRGGLTLGLAEVGDRHDESLRLALGQPDGLVALLGDDADVGQVGRKRRAGR